MAIKCVTCGKLVKPVNGRLKCCGFNESARESAIENKRHSRAVSSQIGNMLDLPGVNAHWNEDTEEFDDYEGLPNE